MGRGQHTITHTQSLQLLAPATCSQWAEDGTKVLLGLKDGRLLEMQAPKGNVDTEKTFEVRK